MTVMAVETSQRILQDTVDDGLRGGQSDPFLEDRVCIYMKLAAMNYYYYFPYDILLCTELCYLNLPAVFEVCLKYVSWCHFIAFSS